MKLVFHIEMLPRVMPSHMYNFSNLLPSCLCTVKFSSQAHCPPPLPPPPRALLQNSSVFVHSVELRASCSRVDDKNVGKWERRKFRYRGNNVTGHLHLVTPNGTAYHPLGNAILDWPPTQFATKHICLTDTSRLNSSHTLMNFGSSLHKRFIIYPS